MLSITLDKNNYAMTDAEVIEYYQRKAIELRKTGKTGQELTRRELKRLFFTEAEKEKHKITEDKGFIIIGGDGENY